MCRAITGKRECPNLLRFQHNRDLLQIDGNTCSGILADEIIVEANKLGIVESLFVLINKTSSLTKQQLNGSVINGELKAFHVFDGDLV